MSDETTSSPDLRAELAEAEAQIRTANATIARVRAVLDQKDSDLDRAELTSLLPLHRRVRISEIRAALDQPGEPT